MSASLISTVIATKLPGPGSIYLKQSLKFLAPVFIDEEISVKIVVLKLIMKKRVKLLTECFKSDKKILTGEAEILVNSKKKLKKLDESFQIIYNSKIIFKFSYCNWKF